MLQAYQTCTAEVDPLLLATINDPERCLRKLEQDFGVEVLRETEHSFNIQLRGSFLQIQSSQAVLDKQYSQSLLEQQQELLLVGAHRSSRSGAHVPGHSGAHVPRRSRSPLRRFDSFSSDYTDDDYLTNRSMPAMYLQRHGSAGDADRTTWQSEKNMTSSQTRTPRSDNENITPQQSPRSVEAASPRDVKQSPRGVNQSPRGVNQSPRGVNQSPRDVNLSPRDSVKSGSDRNDANSPRSVEGGNSRDHSPNQADKAVDDMFETGSKEDVGGVIAAKSVAEVKSAPTRKSKETGPITAVKQTSTESARRAKTDQAESSTNGYAETNGVSTTSKSISHTTKTTSKPQANYKTQSDSATLELDSYVTDYMRKVQQRKIREIEATNLVRISVKKCKEFSEVSILPIDPNCKDTNPGRIRKAKEDLVNVYQGIFYTVVKETVSFDIDRIPKDVYEAVVLAVKRAFSRTVVFQDQLLSGENKQNINFFFTLYVLFYIKCNQPVSEI